MHLGELKRIGSGLKRPECVLAHQSGLLFVADWTGNGGVCVISRSGACHKILANEQYPAIRPNGIALEPNGTFLLAHLGDTEGGIFRLFPNGTVESVVTHANGQVLPPCNYIVFDATGRLWITVSTRIIPRGDDYRRGAQTGFIAVAEKGQTDANIVADNLGYTNELVVDLDREKVAVNETFARRLTEFRLSSNANLSDKSTLTTFTHSTYPDGIALDEHGHYWISSIVSNRIIKVNASGKQQLILEDNDTSHLEICEAAFNNNALGREHLDNVRSKVLQNISSLAFGGVDRKQAFIGNLLGECLHTFSANVSGAAMPHWGVQLGELEKYIDR